MEDRKKIGNVRGCDSMHCNVEDWFKKTQCTPFRPKANELVYMCFIIHNNNYYIVSECHLWIMRCPLTLYNRAHFRAETIANNKLNPPLFYDAAITLTTEKLPSYIFVTIYSVEVILLEKCFLWNLILLVVKYSTKCHVNL